MKTSGFVFLGLLLTGIFFFAYKTKNNQPDPWKPGQLMEPKTLADLINNNKDGDISIFNIGPSGAIKHSIEIGSTKEDENLAKLKTELSKLPENKQVVIYCGCCPFEKCPNVRPAFSLLKEMKFTNGKLLNLPQNLKANWINKGYPMEE